MKDKSAALDPLLALSLSMEASKGVYALLLGSGVSRAARIPTGWEITLDLIGRLAVAKKADCGGDPAGWYRTTFSHEPDYSDLLQQLGRSPEERQQLLRGYFEPTTTEREEGWKMPTKAHRSIAKLVTGGYVKVILTTNFDRLTERAIEEAGITPTVISTPEAVVGALPLIHQKCCVIKLHGDYLDTRIRNTPEELATYPKVVDSLLDRVLDEFGIVVCGWSGVWDTALRAAIERCPARRFTTYWASQSAPAPEAAALLQRRDARLLPIKDADTFFHELAEKTDALENSRRPHPLSAAAAVASLKKYVSEDRYNVQLRDLMFTEGERVHTLLDDYSKEILPRNNKNSDIPGIYHQYRDIIATLLELMVHGCFWSRANTDAVFVASLQQVCRKPKIHSGAVLNDGFTHYPAVNLLYAAGLAALAGDRYDLFGKLLCKPTIRDLLKSRPFVAGLDWKNLREFATTLFTNEQKYAPLSEHLFEMMRQPLVQYAPDDEQYDDLFDRYEYLQALVVADLNQKQQKSGEHFWGPIGRFGWKARSRMVDRSPIEMIDNEADAMGTDWPPLKAGLFDRSVERLKKVREGLHTAVANLPWY